MFIRRTPERKREILAQAVIEPYSPQCSGKGTEEIRKETLEWTNFLSSVLNGIPNVWVSGALSISLATGEIDREHTNTDIALFDNPETIDELTKKLEPFDFYLVYRGWNFRIPTTHGMMRRGYFHPTTPEEAVKRKPSNSNVQYVRVGTTGRILPGETLQNRIYLYLHHREGEKLISREEKPDKKFEVYESFLNGISYSTPRGTMQLINPQYMLAKKKKMAEIGNDSPKHQQDLKKLERFFTRP